MTVQYQGVWSLQSAAQLQSTQRWVTDPLYKNTTLLLQADDAANAAQNNTFLDSSSNSFAITRNGNTTQGSFTPFSLRSGAWSNFFSSSAFYYRTSATPLVLSGGSWTIEAWVFVTGGSNYRTVISKRTGTTAEYEMGVDPSGNFYYYTGTTVYASSISVPQNQWVHLAVSYDGTNLRLFQNGIVTRTDSGITAGSGTGNLAIAAEGGGGTQPFSGYISNARITKGGALYTSNFTPSTIPLTTTVSAGTVSLLTSQSNQFVDNSVNSYTFTFSGTPSVQPFSPFAPQYQWTSSVIGGSGYFDGTGDQLTVSGQSAFTIGTGQFTIECWVYRTASAFQTLFTSDTGTTVVQVFFNSSNTAELWLSASQLSSNFGSVPLNAWSHIIVQRDGSNNMSAYVNGVRGYNASRTDNIGNIGIRVGGRGADYLTGYVSGLKWVSGAALYSGTPVSIPITPPTTAVSSGTTQFLLNFTNAAIFDGTMKNVLETVGNAQVSTAVVKYGSGSMSFDGTTNTYLAQNPATTDLYAFGSGDFTIECWVYLNSTASIRTVYDGRASGTASSATPTIYIDAGTIKYYVSGADRITGIALATGQWYHVAVCRSATSTRMFINGTQVGSTYSDSTVYINSSRRPFIASDSNSAGANLLNGYIDDLRITKGIARYTANFIPPSVALPRQ